MQTIIVKAVLIVALVVGGFTLGACQNRSAAVDTTAPATAGK